MEERLLQRGMACNHIIFEVDGATKRTTTKCNRRDGISSVNVCTRR